MPNLKYINKFKAQIKNLKALFLLFLACILSMSSTAGGSSFAQDDDLELNLDFSGHSVILPKTFLANIDLSGRGFHKEITWPQGLAAAEILDSWQKDLGFRGIYRLQYNLWEISQLVKDKESKSKLMANYEAIIKKVTDSGGIVILDLFSTPQGQGKVLDKKSSPVNLKAFKKLVKSYIDDLSCKKRYSIWYEVWSAPDLEGFFIGRQQEYLNLYRTVAESVKELEEQTKIHIPVGGPSTSWWFRNLDGNTIVTPERSLIYELIKFCYHYKLPLNFISWHAYSTDPQTEKEMTSYNKNAARLVRDWLSYFNFEADMPLVVDEWNYDSGANILPERQEKAYIAASYIPARLKNMYEAGIDYQVFFSLEDFHNTREGVTMNVGAFLFEQEAAGYKSGPKSLFNVFKMLNSLGNHLMLSQAKINDDFVGVIPTKNQEDLIILVYNYVDQDIFRNYISRNIALLKEKERRAVIAVIKSDKMQKIMQGTLDPSVLRASNRVKNLFKKAQQLNDTASRFKSMPRNLKVSVKNLKSDNYLYSRFSADEKCVLDCEFKPVEEKDAAVSDNIFQETLSLAPYSVQMIVLRPKPKEAPAPQDVSAPEAVPEIIENATLESKEEIKTQDINLTLNITAVSPEKVQNITDSSE
jgi:hypothetical protein